jgi:surface carbohydrate biosynthesis protein
MYLLLKRFTKFFFINKIYFIQKNTDIIIFDGEGDLLGRWSEIFDNNKVFVLETRDYRVKNIYFNFKIILKFIKYFFLLNKVWISYLSAVIEYLNPKLIITTIDNSHQFSRVAKILDKKYSFLAIQNAARYDFEEYPETIKKIYIPNFICFSQFEVDYYQSKNVNINNFYIGGSLRIALFEDFLKKEENKKKILNEKFDICLISEPSPGLNKIFPCFEESVARIAEYTIKFCKIHKKKIAFAGKRVGVWGHEEINFYKRYIKEDFKIIPRNKNYFSSYQLMYNSELTVGMMSTMLRENLGRKKKILSCNFTNNAIWDFPISGICFLKDCEYKNFESRVLEILEISNDEYFLKIDKSPNYVMHYSKDLSAKEFLLSRINSFLDQKSL